MDVNLYIYDLSQGLARMYSLPLTGTHIDAIYHTSIVLNGVEYYFGQGIQTAIPGSTHHGQPMEKSHLGKTELPIDVVEEYIESLASIYTPESYDLFLHNCNNFTQDLAMFLVGKNIPEHIRNLPQTFLNTPFGQMMKPQIDQALRGVTQAAAPAAQPHPRAPVTAVQLPRAPVTAAAATPASPAKVRLVSNLRQLEEHLASAVDSCAVVFFTSATCPPCKAIYPIYDELAEEAGNRAVLIKVDISTAYDVSAKFRVRATPTFLTFLKGRQLDEWTGADPAQLRGNIRLLIEMAHPVHPHRRLRLPSFPLTNPITYKKAPPLDKLTQRLRPHDQDPTLASILTLITNPSTPDPTLLASLTSYLPSTLHSLDPANRFALLDLTRLLFLNRSVADYLATERNHTTILTLAPPPPSSEPYNLQLTTLQLLCNLTRWPTYHTSILSATTPLHAAIWPRLTAALLDHRPTLRAVAAALACNFALALAVAVTATAGEVKLALAAAVVEAISRETESREALRGMLFALGMMVYEARDGEVVDLCRAMGVEGMVREKSVEGFVGEGLIDEVGELLRVL